MLLPLLSFTLSISLCKFVRDYAARKALVDAPNERSLHAIAVPRLGGLAIVTTYSLATLLAWSLDRQALSRNVLVASAGGVLVALLGAADDVKPLKAQTRLLVQTVAAVGLCAAVGVGSDVLITPGLWLRLPPVVAFVLWVIWIVAVLNIYNFMDGMDGLAASQSVGVSLVVIAWGHSDVAMVATILAASCVAFLFFNFPPAKMFMGDAGSTFIGFWFAAMTLVESTRVAPLPLVVIPTALVPFLADGSFAILRRLRSGQRIWTPHRVHLYQRAVTSGKSQRKVLLVYVVWSVASVAIAYVAMRFREYGVLVAAVFAAASFTLVWRWVVAGENLGTLEKSR